MINIFKTMSFGACLCLFISQLQFAWKQAEALPFYVVALQLCFPQEGSFIAF